MLHAIVQKKGKYYRSYFKSSNKGVKRAPIEDEITSLIMSPLSFLPPQAIGAFWQALVAYEGSQRLPPDPVMRASMEFWPRRKIEPDMLVKLEWADNRRYWILVEFKWGAGESGEGQLQKQWEEFLSNEERKNAYHIFIAPETSAAINALGRRDVWKGNLLLRTWFQILNVLRELTSISEAHLLWAWAKQVENVLQMLHIQPFKGFCRFQQCHDISENMPQKIFWWGFSGFSHISPPQNGGYTSPFFFKK